MAQVRFWQPTDLPWLLEMAARTDWEILSPTDRAVARPEVVRANSHRNLLATLASPGGTAIVTEDGGRPVGFLLIGIRPDDRTGEPQGYMADIYLMPEYRGRGLAKQMHELGEQYLRWLGIRQVTNWVHATNPLGQKASHARGFRVWGVMMEKLLTG
ncbi:MAG: GNAT family N-acetyltransferase [Symbiobacterium sp.]|uniref:N-acetyltransferase family protein n=1 Tax=Symbiobacterium sp. TaxID=1971213 RepID=UPI003463ACAB